MDRERKLLYLVAVLAAVVQIMTLVAWQLHGKDMPMVVEAQRQTVACGAQLLRAYSECPLRRRRVSTKDLGT